MNMVDRTMTPTRNFIDSFVHSSQSVGKFAFRQKSSRVASRYRSPTSHCVLPSPLRIGRAEIGHFSHLHQSLARLAVDELRHARVARSDRSRPADRRK